MVDETDRPMKAPRRGPRSWAGFVHMLARRRMNYLAAVMRAARRKKRRRVDVDQQRSKQGTPMALHWGKLGKNKLHDPKGVFKRGSLISRMTDEQILRCQYPDGKHPQKLETVLVLAAEHGVEVEVETKAALTEAEWRELLAVPEIARMHARNDLQVKTLAYIPGAVGRLRPAHQAGIPTILSFTKFGRRRKGISKRAAWPVTDYVRGRARWSA